MGFEPTISCVTGRRALRCSTRTYCLQVAQVGFEPAASLVLSQSGLPIAYRAMCVVSTQSRTRTCKRPGLSRTALPIGVSGLGFIHDVTAIATVVEVVCGSIDVLQVPPQLSIAGLLDLSLQSS